MEIIRATAEDIISVRRITQMTISAVYPKYYPIGAVEFFMRHHSDAHIARDIADKKVYLLQVEGENIGTVTICGNEISRLFVLPAFQHKGYGTFLMNFAENQVMQDHRMIILDASLPAKKLYHKRGYKEVAYHMIETENGDFLCYDTMVRVQ